MNTDFFACYVALARIIRAKFGGDTYSDTGGLRRYFGRRPLSSPFRRFGSRFAEDIPKLQANGLLYYPAWAFASVRQAGAAFELAAANLRWQAGFDHPGLVAVADCFEAISQTTRRSFSKAPERLIPAGHLTLP